jgi:hypothetical protein
MKAFGGDVTDAYVAVAALVATTEQVTGTPGLWFVATVSLEPVIAQPAPVGT